MLGSVVVLFLVVLAGVSCVHRGGCGGASPCVLALVVQAGFHVRGVVCRRKCSEKYYKDF